MVLAATLFLVGLGVAMVFSASIPLTAADGEGDILWYLKRELGIVALGLAAMAAVSRVPMEWVRKSARWLLVLAALAPLTIPAGLSDVLIQKVVVTSARLSSSVLGRSRYGASPAKSSP